MQEVEQLPPDKQAEVLAFVRFLRIGLVDPETCELKLTEGLARAQEIAQARGITEQDIAAEIEAARAKRFSASGRNLKKTAT